MIVRNTAMAARKWKLACFKANGDIPTAARLYSEAPAGPPRARVIRGAARKSQAARAQSAQWATPNGEWARFIRSLIPTEVPIAHLHVGAQCSWPCGKRPPGIACAPASSRLLELNGRRGLRPWRYTPGCVQGQATGHRWALALISMEPHNTWTDYYPPRCGQGVLG